MPENYPKIKQGYNSKKEANSKKVVIAKKSRGAFTQGSLLYNYNMTESCVVMYFSYSSKAPTSTEGGWLAFLFECITTQIHRLLLRVQESTTI